MKSCNGEKPPLPELLAPAGNLEKLKTAIHYGADAVYLGGKEMSLRAKAGNFNLEEMREGLDFAHERGKKVFITVNVLAHNQDLESVENYFKELSSLGPDGVIISDPGVLNKAKEIIPGIPIHLSTQANVTNYGAARFWFDQGAARVNLARELSLEEIGEIREKVDGELEVFTHGAICISYSGRCMLSNYLTDRDANKGMCSHPCRFNYALVEEKRPGEYFPVEEDGKGTYIFNSKDLCLLQLLPELIAAGVDSLKIEGRMKSIFYVGGVVRLYRAALDYLGNLSMEEWRRPSEIEIPEELVLEIEKTGTRGITENFARNKPTGADFLYSSSRAEQIVEPVGVVREIGDTPLVEIRNKVECGEEIEYMGPGISLQKVKITSMKDKDGEEKSSANPGNLVRMDTDPPIYDIEILSILRRGIKITPSSLEKRE